MGACASRALALRGHRVDWFEANDPLRGDFSRLSMSCPWAAGQVLARSFEPGTLASQLALRTREVMRELGDAGRLPVQPRPWLACAPKGGGKLADAACEVLETAWDAGRLEGFSRLSTQDLAALQDVRGANMAMAFADAEALGVDPRALAMGLAQWAVETPGVTPHFGWRVTRVEGPCVYAKTVSEESRFPVQAVVLCVGVHAVKLSVDGEPLSTFVPPAAVTHLHVFDHRADSHIPTVRHSVAGPATIARYEVFGGARVSITAHLPQAARDFDVNPLLTDVPGLCRLLDTHFATRAEAEQHNESAREAIADLLHPFINAENLPSMDGKLPITESAMASYVKHPQPDGEPTIVQVPGGIPLWYVQPSNGRGVTQCIGLGEHVAGLVQ